VNKQKNQKAPDTTDMLDNQPDIETPVLERAVGTSEAKHIQSEKPPQALEADAEKEDEQKDTVRALQKTRSSLQSSPRGPRGYLWPIRRALGRTDRTPFLASRVHDKSK
jgi:hypothetical protein